MPVNLVDADVLIRNWWAMVVRGLVAIGLGVLTFLWPGISLAALLLLFGAYMLIDGVFALAAAVFRRDRSEPWWLLVLEGFAGIGAAIVTFVAPLVTAITLLYLIAFWAFATGVFEIIAAVRLRRSIRGEWLLGLGGLLSIALGGLLLFYPGAGALALVLWLGIYAVLFGAVMVALGLRLRSFARSASPGSRDRARHGSVPTHSSV